MNASTPANRVPHTTCLPARRNRGWLCGAHKCSMVSTILMPLSASNVCPQWTGHILDFVLILFDPSSLKRPLDLVVDKLCLHRFRCNGVLKKKLLEWFVMMHAVRNCYQTHLLRISVHLEIEGVETKQGCSGAASWTEIVHLLDDWQMWPGRLQENPWASGAEACTGSHEYQVVF